MAWHPQAMRLTKVTKKDHMGSGRKAGTVLTSVSTTQNDDFI
jgi:hypothetical protein